MTGTVRLLLGREVASHWNDLGCYEYVRISKPLQALLNIFNIFILYSLDFSRIWCWTGLKWNGGVHLLSLQSFIICKDGILDAKGCCAKCLPQNWHDQRRSTKTEAPRSCSSSWSCFVDWIRCITAECHREQGDNEEFLPWFRVKLQQIQENQRRISRESSFLQFHIFSHSFTRRIRYLSGSDYVSDKIWQVTCWETVRFAGPTAPASASANPMATQMLKKAWNHWNLCRSMFMKHNGKNET